jgi:hypothetical protein
VSGRQREHVATNCGIRDDAADWRPTRDVASWRHGLFFVCSLRVAACTSAIEATANESVIGTRGGYGVTVRGCYTYRIKIRLLLEQLLARVGR